jgi:thymidylate kinase
MIQPLSISAELFSRFEAAGVRYCHWKSNEHLLEGLSGRTDLDVLAGHNQYEEIRKVLEKCNCKKVISQPWHRYPDIEDWLGFDEETGRLIHIHLHYKLLMGRRYVKELGFPYERFLLNNALKDEKFKIFIISPEAELALLLIRIAVKTTAFQIASGFFKGSFLPDNIVSEYGYLMDLIDRNSFTEVLHEFVGEKAAFTITGFLRRNRVLGAVALLKIQWIVRKTLKERMRYDFFSRKKIALSKKIQFFISRNKNKYFSPTQVKKIFSGKGFVIAVIGCDGSGKTTVVRSLREWLSWKVDAESFYLGSGDGDIGLMLKCKKKLEWFIKKIKTKNISCQNTRQDTVTVRKSRLRLSLNHFIQSMFYMALAKERYRKVMRIQKAKSVGKVVITDRFPQNQIEGIYDGPQIKTGNTSGVFYKWLKKKERGLYNRIAGFPPDLIIKLHVPIDVSRTRKPDEDYETVRKKISITKQLKYNDSNAIDIDASGDLQEVLRIIKAKVWGFL